MNIPTLLTYQWRTTGPPATHTEYIEQTNQAANTITMAAAGHPTHQTTLRNATKDAETWATHPTRKGTLPLT